MWLLAYHSCKSQLFFLFFSFLFFFFIFFLFTMCVLFYDLFCLVGVGIRATLDTKGDALYWDLFLT